MNFASTFPPFLHAIVRLDRLENRSNLLEPVVSRSIPLSCVVLRERRSYNAEIVELCYCGRVSSLLLRSPFFLSFFPLFFFFFYLLSLIVRNTFYNLGIFCNEIIHGISLNFGFSSSNALKKEKIILRNA